ncbi:MAG TPA: DNA polymerase III subunit epsilon [Gammaproteobacteria bacterium]|nr:DNA polymerase III subunit epsilon [Gammaproteobacteria bacterium]
MRQIVLDTETTGLAPEEGHRVIEIGCIELKNRRLTGQHFHYYLNPEREIDAGAAEVHGLTLDKLRESPRFADIVADFVEFVRGAELVIHNAAFDVGFIDAELARLGSAWGRIEDYCRVFDTLKLARELHPGQRNSLDALCKRYDVDNDHRTLHGALLDAELLADVYLAMTGGQGALGFEIATGLEAVGVHFEGTAPPRQLPPLRVVLPRDDELAAHHARLTAIDRRSGGKCLWLEQEGR